PGSRGKVSALTLLKGFTMEAFVIRILLPIVTPQPLAARTANSSRSDEARGVAMGRFYGPLSVLLAGLLSCRAVQAQQPLLGAPCESTSLQMPPCVCPPPTAAGPVPYCAPPTSLNRGLPFAVELMLGQELGVRGQVAPYADNFGAFVVEGFYGELFTDIG